MSPAADAVIRRLDGARQKWWLFTLLTSAVLAICASLATLLLFMATDAMLLFSRTMLISLFAVWALVSLGLLVLLGRRLVRSQRSIEATARRIEWEFPELGSNLINLVQLSSDTKNVDRSFCEAAVHDAVAKIGGVPLEAAAARETRWGRFAYCMQTPRDLVEATTGLMLLAGLTLVCHLFIPNWGSAATRLMTPWEFVPSVGKVAILKVLPGNTEVLVGASLEVTAEIRNPDGRTYKGLLYVTAEGEKETSLPLQIDERQTTYKATVPAVLKDLKYRLDIGDSQTALYAVHVREKPTIQEVEITFHYPAYLGRADESTVQKTADLEAPQYTVAELKVRPSTPIEKGYVQMESQRFTGTVGSSGELVVKVPLLKDASFTINMFNDAGHSDPDPRLNHVRVLPDRPPTVQLIKPAKISTVAPGEAVPIMIRATDDYAVGRVRLEMEVRKTADGDSGGTGSASGTPADAAAEPVVQPLSLVHEWTTFDGTTNVMLAHRLELDAKKIPSGHTVRIRASAWDKRDVADWGLDLKPQQADSDWTIIRVIAEEAKVSQNLEQLDNLRGNLWKIMEKQLLARVKAAGILQKKELGQRAGLAGDVRADQVEIQKQSVALVASVKNTDKEERLVIKRALSAVAAGDMVEAVRQCDDLVKISAVDAFAKPVPLLTAVQDRIIDRLRKMLDVTRKAQTDVLAETSKRPVGNLPPDVKEKLEEAQKKLEEFLKQQKKVIDATTDASKTPVEDFTQKEEELLKKLAAQEDDLARFLKDLHSDLSKLPDQDFANGSLATELNEVQTELKMAEDALLKKSTDIAVPLEQLGYEKAKEQVSNLEKWLPDKPDREKWSQEEALSDADKEAPMAELPGELEDLIGELAEQEEDLMSEAEDVSSSAIDSLDKGAGWDATDGPISDNSAKGVTGNQLPGENEEGGRSGEGRTGKSSGEFVGDEAVGKGGRKTPSRLTPDPYMKGQIKDHSKGDEGGASGGGKESGSGGEGLEGPAPKDPGHRDMGRLAGKQAALNNKLKGIDLQFQISGFHHTDLNKMKDVMSQMERDFKAGRYTNLLREKKTLLGMSNNVKQYLQGEFEVRKDATPNLPTEIQKEILGSMQEASPAGWEEINREYFERLSSGGGGGGMVEAPAAAGK
jgi:hypothetical protein